MANEASTAPCDRCKSLVADSAAKQSDAHSALNLEWQRETLAIYHCTECGTTLTHNSREQNPWRASLRPTFMK